MATVSRTDVQMTGAARTSSPRRAKGKVTAPIVAGFLISLLALIGAILGSTEVLGTAAVLACVDSVFLLTSWTD